MGESKHTPDTRPLVSDRPSTTFAALPNHGRGAQVWIRVGTHVGFRAACVVRETPGRIRLEWLDPNAATAGCWRRRTDECWTRDPRSLGKDKPRWIRLARGQQVQA